jgi:hypothetical protein
VAGRSVGAVHDHLEAREVQGLGGAGDELFHVERLQPTVEDGLWPLRHRFGPCAQEFFDRELFRLGEFFAACGEDLDAVVLCRVVRGAQHESQRKGLDAGQEG